MVILSTSPSQNAVNVALQSDIVVTFDTDILVDSITPASITVTTKKNNILSPKLDGISVNIFDNENFFDAEFTAIVKGSVFIDPVNSKKLVFRPEFRLTPATEYTVYIAQTISGTDSTLLGVIYTLSFKTHEEDIVEPLPYTPGTTILGKNVLPPDTGGNTELYVVSSIPSNNAIQVSADKITINFSEDIIIDQDTQIIVERFGVFDDSAVTLAETTNYTMDYGISNKQLVITFVDTLAASSIYRTTLVQVTSITDNIISNVTIEFTTTLTPYYGSTRMIRMKAGSLISNITDSQLAMLIYFTSLDADVMLKKLTGTSQFSYLQQRWVLYSTLKHILLNNEGSSGVDSFKKSFGEYRVEITNGSRVKTYNLLLDEINKWLRSFDSMINSVYSFGVFKKGEYTSTSIGRKWERGIQPGLNSRQNNIMVWDDIGIPTPWEIGVREE